jgi:hypothetical protein
MHDDDPNYDKVLPGEEAEEARWKVESGVDPDTGRMWLTPRMERNAQRLVDIWEKMDKIEQEKGR